MILPARMLSIAFVVGGLGLASCQSGEIVPESVHETSLNMETLDMNTDWWSEGSGRVWTEGGQVRMQEDSNGVGVVLWSREILPSDVEISFDVSLSNDRGIFVFFFAATGTSDEDLFETRSSRTGDYEEYIRGNINAYSASLHRYFPDGEHNPGANLRRNAGFNLLNTAMPDPMMESGKIYRVLIRKIGGAIRLEVDGEVIHDFIDTNPLGAGRVGFRLRGDHSCQMSVSNLVVKPVG